MVTMASSVTGDSHHKLEKLQDHLKQLESVAIAFSGGVDSTFLCKVAVDILGEKAIAVTAASSTFPQKELHEAKRLAQEIGITHIIFPSKETENKKFIENPTNRCYYCKRELFTNICQIADENHIAYVLEGSNRDDESDYRPGRKAIAELGIQSPLRDTGLTKQDIRRLSKEMNLPTWDKPAFACLASRFPYGEKITPEKLNHIEKAEDFLSSLGFHQYRVRYHGDIARIEVERHEFSKIVENAETIVKHFKTLGFTYISLDIEGYRTGSLNKGTI